jgi:hypothetical protein
VIAKTAGADVAPETLFFDAAGVVTTVAGLIPGAPDLAIKVGTYALLREQELGEVFGGDDFESPLDDFKSYWVPQDAHGWVHVAAPAVGAFMSAADAGTAADNAPERRRERAEDEVWN